MKKLQFTLHVHIKGNVVWVGERERESEGGFLKDYKLTRYYTYVHVYEFHCSRGGGNVPRKRCGFSLPPSSTTGPTVSHLYTPLTHYNGCIWLSCGIM